MQNFFDDADLLRIFLIGIVVVGVNDAGGIDERLLLIQGKESYQVFVVIVGKTLPVLIDRTAKDCVRGLPLVSTSAPR